MGTLNAFVDRPLLREAFDQHARGWPLLQTQLDQARATSPALAPARSALAFGYLVRFELARWSIAARVDAVATGWVAHLGLHNLSCFPALAPQAKRWATFVAGAQARIGAYIRGEEVAEGDRIRLALHLAQLDPLYRDPAAAAERMRLPQPPSPALVAQLAQWLAHWRADWAPDHGPHQRLLLNPEFGWLPGVGGADVDLVLDDTALILACGHRGWTPALLRRLAGYAALSELTGFHLPGSAHLAHPVQAIGAYFVRAQPGQRIQAFPVRALFPDGEWERYCAVFAEHARQPGAVPLDRR